MEKASYLKDNSEIIHKLKQIPALRLFEEKDLKNLLSISKINEYKAGDIILEEGHFDKWVFYLVAGEVTIRKQGKEIVVLRRTGDVFGEMGITSNPVRAASVYAKEDAICLATDIRSLDELSKKDRLLFRYMLFRAFSEILAHRLKLTTDELVRTKEELDKIKKKS